MILGIGVDIVNIERISLSIEKFGERFLTRSFTPEERVYAQSKKDPVASFAKRFAAKEALSKALGTGFTDGLSWQAIEVRNNEAGKPDFFLNKALSDRLEKQFQSPFAIHLSISDDKPFAIAYVIIEARDK